MSRNNFSGSGLDSPNSTGTKCQPVPLQRGQESFSCRHRTSPARNGPYCPGEGVARLTSSFNATSLPVRYKGYPAAVWDVRPPSRDAPPHSRAPEPGFRSAPAPSYPEYDCFRSLVTAWHPLPLVPLVALPNGTRYAAYWPIPIQPLPEHRVVEPGLSALGSARLHESSGLCRRRAGETPVPSATPWTTKATSVRPARGLIAATW